MRHLTIFHATEIYLVHPIVSVVVFAALKLSVWLGISNLHERGWFIKDDFSLSINSCSCMYSFPKQFFSEILYRISRTALDLHSKELFWDLDWKPFPRAILFKLRYFPVRHL